MERLEGQSNTEVSTVPMSEIKITCFKETASHAREDIVHARNDISGEKSNDVFSCFGM